MLPGPNLRGAIPILPVRDLERAVAFYRKLDFEPQPNATPEYALLRRDATELHLRLAPDLPGTPPESASGVYFPLAAGTAQPLEQGFRHKGVPILSSLAPRPWGMNEFVAEDLDGNLLRFGEPLP